MPKSDEALKRIREAGGDAWDNVEDIESTIRDLRGDEQQTLQGPIGEARSGESGVQSAADVIAELRVRVRSAWNESIDSALADAEKVTDWHDGRAGAFSDVLIWLDELSGRDQKPIEHEAKCVAAD